MSTSLLRTMLRHCIDHLGVEITYSGNGIAPKVIGALCTMPDVEYEIGDGVLVAAHMVVEFLAENITQPMEGDQIQLEGKYYQVVGQPLRESKQLLWKVSVMEVT